MLMKLAHVGSDLIESSNLKIGKNTGLNETQLRRVRLPMTNVLRVQDHDDEIGISSQHTHRRILSVNGLKLQETEDYQL